ncbi:MAG: TonB family protein [Candidatus Omnitrophica bacterium]|nr:TonB family protein [Candidatus Omnitrophota bacterium]
MRRIERIFKKSACWSLCLTLVLSLSLPFEAGAVLQDVVDSRETQDLLLYPGDLVALKVYSLTRIAISRPGIVEIANADVNELLFVGQAVGETQIFIWDEYGKRVIRARVMEEDLDLIVDRLKSLMAASEIVGVKLEKNEQERRIIATGNLPQLKVLEFQAVAKDLERFVINLVKKEDDLIAIDAQVTELNTTLTKELGFDWSTSSSAGGLKFDYEETLPTFSGNVKEWIKLGDFERTNFIKATINALIQEGKGRVLSKPSIVVTDGEEASFLVGGEIPIRTTTTSTGGASAQENVTFKSYGIDLTVTPAIREGRIDLIVNIVIRDIDAANAVGDDVAFTTRTATTRLFLNDSQTVVIAGLIKHNSSESVRRVPLLSAIPVVGLLFRSKKTPSTTQDQEVVITLTPRIVKRQPIIKEAVEEAVAPAIEKKDAEPVKDSVASAVEEGVPATQLEEAGAPVVEAKSFDPSSSRALVMTEEEFMSELSAGEVAPNPSNEETEVLEENLSVEIEPTLEFPPEEGVSENTVPSNEQSENYIQAVKGLILDNISFPDEARENGWSGVAVLNFKILKDGSIKDVVVKESSGQQILDDDALSTVQMLAPFDPLPEDLGVEELEVTIPVEYQ